jgi:hypothetical protein
MKKLLPFLMFLGLFLSQACEGPEGPAGPPGPAGTAGAAGATGPAGPAGTSTTASVFQFSATFTAANEYTYAIGFAQNNITVGEFDGVFVYTYYGTYQNFPLWAPLPNTNYVGGKPLIYNFVYSHLLVAILVEAEASVLTAAGDPYLKDQAFRVVIVPGKKLRTDGTRIKFNPKDYPVDFNNYEEVVKYFNIPESNVRKVTPAPAAAITFKR